MAQKGLLAGSAAARKKRRAATLKQVELFTARKKINKNIPLTEREILLLKEYKVL